MALTTAALAHFMPTRTRHRLLGGLAVVAMAPLIGFAAAPGVVGAFFLLALSGAGAAYQTTAGATFVELTSDGHRGQAVGLARTGLMAGQGLGVAAGGLVAELTGSITNTIALAGGLGLLLAVPAARQ